MTNTTEFDPYAGSDYEIPFALNTLPFEGAALWNLIEPIGNLFGIENLTPCQVAEIHFEGLKAKLVLFKWDEGADGIVRKGGKTVHERTLDLAKQNYNEWREDQK